MPQEDGASLKYKLLRQQQNYPQAPHSKISKASSTKSTPKLEGTALWHACTSINCAHPPSGQRGEHAEQVYRLKHETLKARWFSAPRRTHCTCQARRPARHMHVDPPHLPHLAGQRYSTRSGGRRRNQMDPTLERRKSQGPRRRSHGDMDTSTPRDRTTYERTR